MSEGPHKKQDIFEVAKQQVAQLAAELEKALQALRDPERRTQLTSSYLDMLQKSLARAQETVAKYQAKVAPQAPTAVPEDRSASDSSPAAEPMTATPDSEPGPPPS